GRAFGLAASASDPAIGSQFRVFALTWFFQRFLEMPFAQHHVLALHYAGGISGGESGRRRLFFLGGFPQLSLVDGFREGVQLGGQALRGYSPNSRAGTRYQLLQLEYRLPLWRPQAGYATLPLFFRRVYGSVFLDVGDAYSRTFDVRQLRTGVGAELFVQLTTWYFVEGSSRTGGAYGLQRDGGPPLYTHLGAPG